MKNVFYPVVTKDRTGNYEVYGRSTKRGAACLMNRLQADYTLIKISLLVKGTYTRETVIADLKKMAW